MNATMNGGATMSKSRINMRILEPEEKQQLAYDMADLIVNEQPTLKETEFLPPILRESADAVGRTLAYLMTLDYTIPLKNADAIRDDAAWSLELYLESIGLRHDQPAMAEAANLIRNRVFPATDDSDIL